MGTVRILRIDPHHLWGWLWFKLPAHLFNEWINDVTATARTTTTRIESIWGSCFKLKSFRWRHGWWWWWCKCAFNYVQAYFFKWTTHSLQLFLLGKWTIHSLVFSYLRNFQSNHKKVTANQFEELSILYSMPGFEHTTSASWGTTRNH